MEFRSALFGHNALAADRADLHLQLTRLACALKALDVEAKLSPVRSAWLRVEELAGVATAAREGGHEAALETILSARIGAETLPRDHASMAELEDRLRPWREVAQRKGSVVLRGLVHRLVPVRGAGDLLAVADAARAALADCVGPSHLWLSDDVSREPQPLADIRDPSRYDVGDLAMAMPFALRRAGLVSLYIPSITGRPRWLGREMAALDLLKAWTSALARDVEDAHGRLQLIEQFYRASQKALLDVRRPAPMQRILAVALRSWGLWGAQVAKDLDLDGSTAWRALGHAADLGLVAQVPMQRRSRGDAVLYAAPPWLTIARLVARPRGRPPTHVNLRAKLRASEALDDALATLDALLGTRAKADLDRHSAPEAEGGEA